ncbi:MAG: thioredoxin family protein [Rhodococcus sp.]|uniref:thioredoxin family protein n=1 Tax=Rhodococcus TaxID=1827 RepID=UPI0016B6A736|nr:MULTISPECIES: thioredoxin family protein [Rhodococcus]NLV79784.1 thioredoxin family protein [Rhodococcus sp. (in: high G+C Gram-positive bacteria)]
MTALVVLAAVVVATVAAGLLMRSRDGRIRDRRTVAEPDSAVAVGPELAAAGVGAGDVVILHFSAPWCGPCAAVRRVLARVVEDAAGSGRTVRDVELDLDENPAAAKHLGVLSLPTTFVFDGDGRECFRVSGVPAADDVTRALAAL